MIRYTKDRRRPGGRAAWEVRRPGFSRPTVHPNPAGMDEKPCGGVMCGQRPRREER